MLVSKNKTFTTFLENYIVIGNIRYMMKHLPEAVYILIESRILVLYLITLFHLEIRMFFKNMTL